MWFLRTLKVRNWSLQKWHVNVVRPCDEADPPPSLFLGGDRCCLRRSGVLLRDRERPRGEERLIGERRGGERLGGDRRGGGERLAGERELDRDRSVDWDREPDRRPYPLEEKNFKYSGHFLTVEIPVPKWSGQGAVTFFKIFQSITVQIFEL